MDYGKSLNLPKTKFSMKANLSQREPQFIKEWEKEELYKKILEKNKNNNKKFILHDGPPYANGHIHLGHSLNKILKDIIIKSKNMEGFYSPYVPGWDCHGLPIELQVIKNLKGRKISQEELRKECRKYAKKFINIQKEEFKRLGVLGDWDNPYLTMSEEYEQAIVDTFGELVKKGYIYRDLKPVYWCPSCQTALAEAEVEYEDHSSPSVTVKFPLKNNPFDKDAFWLIWTTTPWTLPANVAICIHPDEKYVKIKVREKDSSKEEYWFMADALVDSLISRVNYELIEKENISKDDLQKFIAIHPFLERDSKIVFDKYVSMDTGTGCVHIAPGHGDEDYQIGLNYNLPVISPVDDEGRFTEEVGVKEWVGKKVFDANEDVISLLSDKGLLLRKEDISHSYPHCWRCKNPIIFRSTYQWFLKVDHNDLRNRAINSISKVEWIPKWGEERLGNMLKDRPDWCLSRQRSWGVPIPALYCEKCGEVILNEETVNYFSNLVKKEGVDIWFTKNPSELLPEGYKCPKCGATEFRKESDLLDVWFDSGVSHIAVLDKRDNLKSPADMYLEGSDQYRGWFQSSLLPSVALKDEPPYKAVLTHGFTLDAEGKAMHKSAGNVISPFEIINKYGADILRLWVSSLDYKDDMRIGEEIIKRLVESYRKIRNTFRYILGNINNFQEENIDYNNPENFDDFDKWILVKLYKFQQKIKEAYNNYEFHLIYHNVINFCSVTLSNLYFDALKDRLYIEPINSFKGKSSRYALIKIFKVLVKLIAPILSFTAEDAWKVFLSQQNKEFSSIHIENFEDFNIDVSKFEDAEKKWDRIFEVRDEVNKALEESKKDNFIGHTLEARVLLLSKKDKIKNFINANIDILPFAFIVSQVELVEREVESKYTSENDELKIYIVKAKGKKCERCWNFSESVGQDKEHPGLCDRCSKIVKEYYSEVISEN